MHWRTSSGSEPCVSMMSRATRSLLGWLTHAGSPSRASTPAAPARPRRARRRRGAPASSEGLADRHTDGLTVAQGYGGQPSRPPDAVHRYEPMPADRAGSVGGRTHGTDVTDHGEARLAAPPIPPGHHRAARAPRPDRDHRQGAARTRPRPAPRRRRPGAGRQRRRTDRRTGGRGGVQLTTRAGARDGNTDRRRRGPACPRRQGSARVRLRRVDRRVARQADEAAGVAHRAARTVDVPLPRRRELRRDAVPHGRHARPLAPGPRRNDDRVCVPRRSDQGRVGARARDAARPVPAHRRQHVLGERA